MSARNIGYWVSTAIVAFVLLSGGVADVAHWKDTVEAMTRLGYPVYFTTLLGVWKLLGGLALLAPRLPRLKEWAYAGAFFDFSGAVVSHASVGDPVGHLAFPLALTVLTLVSWALRPSDRMLGRLRPAPAAARAAVVVATLAAATAAWSAEPAKFLTQPLVKEIYTADPSAHVFGGRIYVYPSHDIEAGIPQDDLGSHFAMRDYRVLSMDAVGGPVTVHDVALDIKDVPWAGRQMWAPDAAEKGGKYFLYFPVKDKQDVFRIGVAVGDKPAGPFKAQPQPITGSYSIDPAVFKEADGKSYLYFGGIWGGQLQRWKSGAYKAADESQPPNDQPALMPKMARLADDMLTFAEPVRDILIQDESGKPLLSGDHARRFFEAPWLHKVGDTYYLSYSTGDTHFIVYATGKSPYGPFTYRGRILEPVLGWTNHHSIVEFQGKSYLFYHDAQVSDGKTHLRNVKVTELRYRPDGSIVTIDAYKE